MMSSNKYSPLYIVLGLFAIYLILKWTCRLIFGLLDYAIFIGLTVAVVWYIRLPKYRRQQLQERIKTKISYIGQKLGMD